MGYYTQIEGDFAIIPPLTRKELRNAGYDDHGKHASGWRTLKPRVESTQTETDYGYQIEYTCNQIVPADTERFKAYGVLNHMQEIIDAFPGHEFTGLLECTGEDPGDLWRVYVKNGKAIKVTPEIVWPEP
jgi:Family of unknown function (DUF6205)